MKKIHLIISMLFFVATCFAQNEQKQETNKTDFTMQEAVDYAYENNQKVKNAVLDVNIAKKKVWETTAMGLPKVEGAVSYQNTFDTPKMQMMTSIPLYDENGIHYGHDFMVNEASFGQPQTTTFDVTVSQLIFSGEYIVGLMASKTYKEISEKSLTKTKLDVKSSVEQLYLSTLLFEELKKFTEQNLENINKTVNEMSKMNSVGMVEETEVDQLRLTASNINNVLLSFNRQIELNYARLKYQMGIPINKTISLTQSIDDFINDADFQKIADESFSAGANIDYQIIETQEKVAELNLKREKTTVLPTISAFYKHTEYAKEPEFSFQQPDMVGVTMNIPIFASGTRYSKIKQQTMEYEKAKNTKAEMESGLTLQFLQTKADLHNALEKYKTEKENMELSKKIYDRTLAKLKAGMASSMDLTQTQNQYIQTQSNYYNALMEVFTSKINIEKMLGK